MKSYRTRGFTLVELMVTISIIILAAMMVVPLVEAMTGSNRVEGALLEVQGYMGMARQEATQFNKTVAVRFVPPTHLTPQPRLMLEIMKEGKTDPANPANWQVKAGAYGAKLTDMVSFEKVTLWPLVLFMIAFGVYPTPLVDFFNTFSRWLFGG